MLVWLHNKRIAWRIPPLIDLCYAQGYYLSPPGWEVFVGSLSTLSERLGEEVKEGTSDHRESVGADIA